MNVQLKNKIVKSAKIHTCWGCAEKINVGEKASYVVNAGEDGFLSTYWCMICHDFMMENIEDFSQDDIGISFGDFRSEENYQLFKEKYNQK